MKNKHKLFGDMARLVAKQSTCCRMQVGAVLVKEGRVISIGFNGVPSGQEHCEDHFKNVYQADFAAKYPSCDEFIKTKDFYDMHGLFSNDNELHAEQNTLSFAARNGIATEGAHIYVTLSPCIHCAKIMIAAGIKKVYFLDLYDRSQEGIHFLNKNGVQCRQLTEEDFKK
jgi:dCMP deaminase